MRHARWIASIIGARLGPRATISAAQPATHRTATCRCRDRSSRGSPNVRPYQSRKYAARARSMRSTSASAVSRSRSGRLGEPCDAPFARRMHEDAHDLGSSPQNRRGAAADDDDVAVRRRTRAPRPAPREAALRRRAPSDGYRRAPASPARGPSRSARRAIAAPSSFASTASRRDAKPLGDDDGKLLVDVLVAEVGGDPRGDREGTRPVLV